MAILDISSYFVICAASSGGNTRLEASLEMKMTLGRWSVPMSNAFASRRVPVLISFFAIMGLALSLSAQSVHPESVEFSMTNDYPLGVYNEISTANLGWLGQLNMGFDPLPILRIFAQVTNGYWLSMPDYIDFGTQIGAMAGGGLYFPVKEWPRLGVLKLGGGAGYGMLSHLVVGAWRNDINFGAFMDQLISLEAEASLDFFAFPLGTVLKTRYVFSPEQNGLQKHQLSIMLGGRFGLNGAPRPTKVAPVPEPVTVARAEPLPEPKFEPAAISEPVQAALVEPEPVPPAVAEAEPAPTPEPDPVVVVAAEPEPEPMAVVVAEPEPAPPPPPPTVQSIRLEREEIILTVGEALRIAVEVLPADAGNRDLIWQSENASLLSVDGNGTAKALAVGKGVLRVMSVEGEKTASARFQILERPENILKSLEPSYSIGDRATSVAGGMTLPTIAPDGTKITWISGRPDVLGSDGNVKRPDYFSGDAKTTLTLIFERAGVVYTKSIDIVVKAAPMSDAQIAQADTDAAVVGFAAKEGPENVTAALKLKNTGANGASIEWASSEPGTIGPNGSIARPPFGSGDRSVILTATIRKGESVETKTFTLVVKEAAQTDVNKAEADANAIAIQYAEGDSADSVRSSVRLQTAGANGSRIEWSSDVATLVSAKGEVKLPLGEDRIVTLSAKVIKGKEIVTRTFPLRVKDASVEVDLAALAIGYAQGDSAASVTKNVLLPVSGPHGTAVRWTSDNPAFIAADGSVVRPVGTDASATLTATLSKDGREASMSFVLAGADASVDIDAETLAIMYSEGDSQDFVTQNISLPGEGRLGSKVTWTSASMDRISENGVVAPPLGKDARVVLTAVLEKDKRKVRREFTLVVKDFSVLADSEALELGFGAGDTAVFVTKNLSLANAGKNGSAVAWRAEPAEIVTPEGIVTRPEGMDLDVTLVATLTKADRSVERRFTVKVIDIMQAQITKAIDKQIKANNLKNITVAETARGIAITAGGLNFPPDLGTITKEIAAKLDVLGLILKGLDLRRNKVLVEGHSADVGTKESQVEVSLIRAKAVAQYFVDKGVILSDRVLSEGVGGTVPIADNKTTAGREKNRRVEMIILSSSDTTASGGSNE